MKNIINIIGKSDFEQFDNLITASQYIKLYNLTNKYTSEDSICLDWGMGDGHFSYYLLTKNKKVHSFTLDEKSVKINSNTNLHMKIGNDPRKLPYENEYFDTVFSVGVLEHVRETGGDEISSLIEIKRVLKPGGIFICYHFPNKYTWIEKVSNLFTNKYYHLYKFSKKDIFDLLNKVDFKCLEHSRYGFLPRNIFKSFPKCITNNYILSYLYNRFDCFFESILSPLNQNHYFVAKK